MADQWKVLSDKWKKDGIDVESIVKNAQKTETDDEESQCMQHDVD